MVKRKLSETSKLSPQIPASSDSDDSDIEPAPKRLATRLSTPICNTPIHTEGGSNEAAQAEHNDESFANFLKSISLDEETKVSQNISISNNKSPQSNAKHLKNSYLQQSQAYESCRSLMEKSTFTRLGTKVIVVPSKNLEIVSLQHPSSLTLHGYVKVSVLKGRISVLGYVVEKKQSAKVFSTESTTLIKATTLKSNNLSGIRKMQKALNALVPEAQDEELEAFMEQIEPGSVVMVIKKCILSPELQFLESYFPAAVQIHGSKKFERSLESERLCSTEKINAFAISADWETISEEIKKAFSLSISEPNCGPRIVVHGSKHSGKSSLLRYLINKTLNEFPAVYYLDIDPGQTEFTPPGVVSLIKVTEPLLGPPYSHQRRPLKMIFTGSISAGSSPPMYIKSVVSLIDAFKATFPKEMLFVNTMGWTEGVGGMCFENVKQALDPTILIEIVEPDQPLDMKKDILDDGATRFQITATKHLNPSSFSAINLRNFALMAYFGKLQKIYLEPTYIHKLRPVVVCWDKIAVHVAGKNIPPNRLIEAIHCSVVGLCRVNRANMLESDQPEFPRTLYDESINECLGFGIVRATDETNHWLYIVTPLSIEELKPVNAIIKGNVLLPDAVYLKQDVSNVPLPYTDSSGATLTRTTIRKRASRRKSQIKD